MSTRDGLRLPLLEPHRDALEKCVYCPKLSRASCPVSNAEGIETLTPWGKMSMAYFVGRGDVPADAEHAAPAWACSACTGCRERCDHKNDVATTLIAARADLFARGVAPEPARRLASRFSEHARAHSDRVTRRDRASRENGGAQALVLVGCGYEQHLPEVADQAWTALEAMMPDRRLRPVRSCCGLPLHYAGDRPGFIAAARALADEVRTGGEIVAVDPGCAHALAVEYPRLGIDIPGVTSFVEVAARGLPTIPRATIRRDEPLRYHDPCMLGRGLGRFDEPRAVIAHVSGAAPLEFQRNRRAAECSGGGGLVPTTLPGTSRKMATERLAEHHRGGGGTVVTGCAQSLRRFRANGEPAVDIVSLVAEALSGRY